MRNNVDMAISRRKELLELIAAASDEIAALDRDLSILYSQAQEDDVLRSEEKSASSKPTSST